MKNKVLSLYDWFLIVGVIVSNALFMYQVIYLYSAYFQKGFEAILQSLWLITVLLLEV